VHVLVLVLGRAVDDLDLVVIHQDAAGHGALSLTVVFGGGEHREHSAGGGYMCEQGSMCMYVYVCECGCACALKQKNVI
jgi:hypothetical protein